MLPRVALQGAGGAAVVVSVVENEPKTLAAQLATYQDASVSARLSVDVLPEPIELFLPREGFTQSHLGKAAARLRKYTPGQPCATTWRRTHCA